jgi:hypothetical protein
MLQYKVNLRLREPRAFHETFLLLAQASKVENSNPIRSSLSEAGHTQTATKDEPEILLVNLINRLEYFDDGRPQKSRPLVIA